MSANKTIDLNNSFEGFGSDSKIWIYAADRFLNDPEREEMENLLSDFTRQWTAHDKALKAAGKVLYDRFIVLTVDESKAGASGCSIDKSVHFIRDLETRFGLHLFDRLTIYYLLEGQIKSISLRELKSTASRGTIHPETLIFDTTLVQLGAWRSGFLKKAGSSWLANTLFK